PVVHFTSIFFITRYFCVRRTSRLPPPSFLLFEHRHLVFFLHFFFFNDTPTPDIYTISLHDALPIWPSLVLFLVLWLKLVKDFLKVRCRLALLPFLISCLIWLDLVASLPLIKERILVIILLLHFLSLMLGSVLVLMLPLLVWL